MDYTKKIMTAFASKAKRRDRAFVRRPEWLEGKNVFRLFATKHQVNEWDILRGDLGFTREDLGAWVDVLVVPITRYWRDNIAVNGISRDYNCPLFRGWCELPQAERQQRSRERPQDLFAVNALNMRSVANGIEPVFFTKTEWLGESSQNGEQLTYGIYHLYAGYGGHEKPAAEGGEELLGPGSAGLPAFNGFGPEILGPKGQDIVIFKKFGSVGGEKVLRLDKTIKGGPVQVVPKKSSKGEVLCVEVPDRLVSTAQDLLFLPSLFPGWAGDDKHIPHPDYPNLVADFCKAVATFKETGELPPPRPPAPASSVLFTEKVTEAEPAPGGEEKPKKAGRKSSKSVALVPGAKVVVRDTEEDDGVEVEMLYHGTIGRVLDHGHRYEVVLVAEEQPSPRAQEAVRSATETQLTNTFVFEAAKVSPRD